MVSELIKSSRRTLVALAVLVGLSPVVAIETPAAAATQTYSNSQAITLPRPADAPPTCRPDLGPGGCADTANPYPSQISVSTTGTITDVNVTLNGLWHDWFGPADLDIMLVAPDGTGVMLMSDACSVGDGNVETGHNPIPSTAPLTLTFDDEAPAPLPADQACTSGTFRPHDDDTGPNFAFARNDEFIAPPSDPLNPPVINNSGEAAYPTPNTDDLSALDGKNPNGNWRLYVIDDWPGNPCECPAGAITGGWSLQIASASGAAAIVDFGGDARSDVSVFRDSGGTWYTRPSSGGDDTAVAFGDPGDVPVPGDYDGDHKTDVAIFRPSTGLWAIGNSGGGADTLVTYGISTDIPVPADYDGDGKTDIALFRPSVGAWFVHRSTDGGDTIITYGNATDVPVPADYDGDSKADIAVYRDGSWFARRSSDGVDTAVSYGLTGDIPLPGDYDGDAQADLAIYRPSTGLWAMGRSGGGADVLLTWGISTDTPVPADYDGDAKFDVAIFRPDSGLWAVHPSGGDADWILTFGIGSDTPLALPYAVSQALP